MPPLTRAEKAERRAFALKVKANKEEREARRLANIEPNKAAVAAFVAELTVLSKKHGVFIRAPDESLRVFVDESVTAAGEYLCETDPRTGYGYDLHWQVDVSTKEDICPDT